MNLFLDLDTTVAAITVVVVVAAVATIVVIVVVVVTAKSKQFLQKAHARSAEKRRGEPLEEFTLALPLR